MKGSISRLCLYWLVLSVFAVTVSAPADVIEPTPEDSWRPLRDDAVKTWYVYNDSLLDGILDPGDTKVETFGNWWTRISSHTQHNYQKRDSADGQDWSSAPMNGASDVSAGNFWLARQENTMQLYMSYSQFDNNDWKNGFDYGGKTGDMLAILQQRHECRNGYVLGWVTHDLSEPNTQEPAGTVKMDVFIHNGQALGTVDSPAVDVAEWGGSGDYTALSYSNPQVSVSNDIDPRSLDEVSSVAGAYHPPVFDDATGTYSWSANQLRFEAQGKGYTSADLGEVVDSMEVREYLPDDGTWATEAVHPGRRPELIEMTLTDHNGAAYRYADAFRDRSTFHEGASDGGVIAGLAGQSDYDEQENNWGDQQVIRIDIDSATLAEGNIDRIVFWDFGDAPPDPGASGTQQTDPRMIEFLVDLTRTVAEGQIYYDGPAGRVYFPENRIYIAQVEVIPEPGALAILVLGGIGMLLRRRRRA